MTVSQLTYSRHFSYRKKKKGLGQGKIGSLKLIIITSQRDVGEMYRSLRNIKNAYLDRETQS